MAVVAGVQASLGLESAGFLTGLNQATAAMNNMASNANNAANNVNQSFTKVSTSARRMRGEFQNLAFQLQDVAVSLQMGMDPIRVFTQQAGQIAQIFGPMGAAIGVALTVVGGLGGALLGASSAMRKTAEEADNLNVALDRQIITLDKAVEAYLQLNNTQREALQFKLETQFFTQADALNALQIQLDETAAAYTSTAAAQLSLGENAGAVQQLVSEFLSGARDAKDFARGVRELAEASDNEAIDTLAASVSEMAIKLVETQSGMDETRVRLKALDTLGRGAAGGINELTGALNSLNPAAAAATAKLADLELEVSKAVESGLTKEVMDARKEIEARTKAIEDAARKSEQAAKKAATDAERLAEARSKSLEGAKTEAENTRRLIDALEESEAQYRAVQVQIEGETEARKLGLDLKSAEAQAIIAANKERAEEAHTLEIVQQVNAERNKELEETIKLMGDLGLLKIKPASMPGVEFDTKKTEEEMSEPFKNALQSVQAEFTTTFEQMTRGGIRSFQDLSDAVVDIFANLNANILSLAIFDPTKFKEMAAQSGLSPGALGGMAAGTALFPTALGLFGANQASQNAALGGGIGAGVGALAGSFIPGVGTALGAIAGGGIGTLGGGLLGGLFGGGGSQTNKISVQGLLGTTAGGTGAGAQFVAGLDKQLMDLLDARTELLLDEALKAAPAASVQYSKTPSANDLANLARARIGPAASAVGLRPELIAVGTPEEQLANLQSAIDLLKQIEAIEIGPIATQFRDLDAQFVALNDEANRLGVATASLAGEHARSANVLTQEIRKQAHVIFEAVGAWDPLTRALQDLDADFTLLAMSAEQLGISTATLSIEHQRQAEIIYQQNRLQQISLMETVGAMDSLSAALATLDANMQIARINAERLGISTANIGATQAVAAEQIRAQFRGGGGGRSAGPSPQELARQRLQDLTERHALMETLGLTSSLAHGLADLSSEMQFAKTEAERLGYSTAKLARTEGLAANELVEQDRLRRHGVMEQLGLTNSLQRQLADLAVNMRLARIEAERLGYSVAFVARQEVLAATELQQQDRLRRHAAMEQLGLTSPLERALADLDAQMMLARVEAERLGYSTARLTQEHHRLHAAIVREHEAVMDAQALSITAPFEQLLDPLREFATSLTLGNLNPADQMRAAGDEFHRIAELARAGSTTAIQQLQGAGEAFISQMERFGASPGGASARIEVQSVIESVMADISQAQREASAGLEDTIRLASQRQVDTLRELIDVGRTQIEEIKRLRR